MFSINISFKMLWCYVGIILIVLMSHQVFGDVCSTHNASCSDCLSYQGCAWCKKTNIPVDVRCMSREYIDNMICEDIYIVDRNESYQAVNESKITYSTRIGRYEFTHNFHFEYVGLGSDSPFGKIYFYSPVQEINAMGNFQCDRTKNNCTAIIYINVESCPKSRVNSIIGSIETYNIEIELDVECGDNSECDCTPVMTKPCNGRGVYNCGMCTCHQYWFGPTCEELNCGNGRSDVLDWNSFCKETSETVDDEDIKICNGNGDCICGNCECNESNVNMPDYFCNDICTYTKKCAICMITENATEDFTCQEECNEIYNTKNTIYTTTSVYTNASANYSIESYGDSVQCEVIDNDGCQIMYKAVADNMKNSRTIWIMEKRCGVKEMYGILPSTVWVPITLVLAALSLLGFAYAYFMRDKVPPMDPSNSVYTQINSADKVISNPIYKSPKTTYKNPTYNIMG